METTQQFKLISIPKYYQLKQIILQEIKDGKYSADTKLPSEIELIQKYGVSSITARRVRHELVREGVAYSIQGKGCFVKGINNKKNGSSEKGKQYTRRIVFIMPDASVEYSNKLIQGLLDITQPKGYRLEIYNSDDDYTKETKLLSKCLEEPISGLIFNPITADGKYNHLFQLQKKGITVILMGNDLPNYNFDFVGIDEKKGVKKAISYLIKMGHRKIVYLGGGLHLTGIRARFEGYILALKKNRINPDPDLILTDNKKIYNSSEEEGYQRIKEFLKKNLKFTAVFAKDDMVAFGVLKALKEKNIKVPDDVSIIGFDDFISQYFEVPLTTVKQEPYYRGYYTAKLLMKRIENPDSLPSGIKGSNSSEKILLPTKLVIRDSVKKIK